MERLWIFITVITFATLRCTQGCSQCNDQADICIKCAPTYTMQLGSCVTTDCYEGCTTCTANAYNQCESCDGLHILHGRQCLLKSAQCSTNCISCLSSLPNQCLECSVGTLSASPGYCIMTTNCPDGCIECFFQGKYLQCLKCNGDYTLKDQGCVSQKCNSNCKECSANSTCLQCNEEFILINLDNKAHCATKTCQDDNCQFCTEEECVMCMSDYKFAENHKCMKCHPTCQECSSVSSEKCSSCLNGYRLSPDGLCLKQTCAKECAECVDGGCIKCINGYFLQYNLSPSVCVQCPAYCSSCNSANECTLCSQNSQMKRKGGKILCILSTCEDSCFECVGRNKNDCVTCKPSYPFFENGVCFKMSCNQKNCLKCFGDLEGKCLSCENGYILRDGGCYKEFCSASCKLCSYDGKGCLECNEGFYLNSQSKACNKCHKSCLTCKGGNQTECNACSENYFMKDSVCITSNCSEGCATCFGLLRNECLECKEGYTLSIISGKMGKCMSSKCPKGCLVCNSPYYDSCTQCEKGYSMLGINLPSICVLDKCYSTCDKCVGSDGTECVLCKKGYHLLGSIPSPCMGAGNKCFKGCKECYGPEADNCVSCESNYIYNDKTNTCGKIDGCAENCLECIGSEKTQCTKCVQLLKIISYSGNKYGECSDYKCKSNCKFCHHNSCIECQDGYYLLNGECVKCLPQCLTCSGQGLADCNECSSGYSKVQLNNEYICALQGKCAPGCKACFSSSSNDCILCENNLLLDSSPSFCYSKQCYSDCEKCNQNICIQCKVGFILYANGSCIPQTKCLTSITNCDFCVTIPPNIEVCSKCSIGYSVVNPPINDKYCIKCDETCSTCYGEGATFCSLCAKGLSKISFDGQTYCAQTICPNNCQMCTLTKCLKCNPSYNLLSESGQCVTSENCYPSCQTCTEINSPSKCVECREPYKKDNKHPGYCVIDECYSSSCMKCFGPDFDECVECSGEKIVRVNGIACITNKCNASCKSCIESMKNLCTQCNQNYRSMILGDVFECYKLEETCPKSCSSCTTNNMCLSCNNPYYILIPTRPSICLSSECLNSCKICSADDNSKCLICKPSFIMAKSSSSSYCISYQNCSFSCSSCIGSGISECYDCKHGFTKTSRVGACLYQGSCHSSCSQCFGPLANQCVSCSKGYKIDEFTGYCISEGACINPLCDKCISLQKDLCVSCSQQSVLSIFNVPSQCIQISNCYFGCLQCQGTKANQCTFCKGGFQLEKGYCIAIDSSICNAACNKCFDPTEFGCYSCKEGYTSQQLENEMVCKSSNNCHQSCKSCIGPDSNQCAECADNFEKYKGNPLYCIEKGLTCFNKNCLKCIGNEAYQCLECSNAYSLVGSKPSVCAINGCYDGCKICTGQFYKECLECNPGYIKSNEGKVFACITTSCFAGCYQCIGKKQTDCIMCHDGYRSNKENAPYKCTNCHNSCKYCDQEGAQNCIECAQTYELEIINKTKYCITKQGCSSFCAKCFDQQNCIECAEGSVLSQGVCIKCHENCKTCLGNKPYECMSCKIGFSMYMREPSFCVINNCPSNCKFCLENNVGACIECIKPYTPQGVVPAKCMLCSDNCEICNELNDKLCTKCIEGYYLVDSKCYLCHSSCLTCTAPAENNCITCGNGRTLYQSYCASTQCLDANCSLCKDINRQSTCLKCMVGSALNALGVQCEACQLSCITCQDRNPNVCLSCAQKYYLKSQNCLECPKGCAECNENGCIKCDNALIGVQENNQLLCVRTDCSVGCRYCNFDYSCIRCSEGFFMSGSICKKCATGCIECTEEGDDKCKTCASSFTKTLVEGRNYCTSNYCHPECMKCFGNLTCIDCKNGYFMESIIGDCISPMINVTHSQFSIAEFNVTYNFAVQNLSRVGAKVYINCPNSLPREILYNMTLVNNSQLIVKAEMKNELTMNNCALELVHFGNISVYDGKYNISLTTRIFNITKEMEECKMIY